MISEETPKPEGEPIPEQGARDVATQPNDEQKREVARWVAEGMGLSDIQKKINVDFSVVMTYMDVRFLVDDLDLTLVDEEEAVSNEDGTNEDGTDADGVPNPAPEDSPQESKAGAGVQVELDTVNPPGSMASGSVVFSDGERKTWTVDQFGRLALSGGAEDYKPSEGDIAEFQKELDSALRGKGI